MCEELSEHVLLSHPEHHEVGTPFLLVATVRRCTSALARPRWRSTARPHEYRWRVFTTLQALVAVTDVVRGAVANLPPIDRARLGDDIPDQLSGAEEQVRARAPAR